MLQRSQSYQGPIKEVTGPLKPEGVLWRSEGPLKARGGHLEEATMEIQAILLTLCILSVTVTVLPSCS